MTLFKDDIALLSITCSLLLYLTSGPVVGEPGRQKQNLATIVPDQTAGVTKHRYSFNDLANMAVTNHPDIAASQAELNTARLEVEEARYQFYPTPSVAYGRAGGGTPMTTLALDQPLWTGGRLTSALNARKTRVLSQEAGVKLSRFDLTVRLINFYQQWLMANGQIKLQKGEIIRLEKFGNTMDKRIEKGVSAEADKKLVDSRLSQSRGSLDSFMADERRALAQLSQVVGIPLYTDNLYAVTRDAIPPLFTSIDKIINTVYQHHPALLEINNEIEATEYDRMTEKAGLFPAVLLRAEQIFGGFRGDHQTIFLSVNYSPGAGLSSLSRIAASASRAEGLRRNRDNLKRELTEEIYRIYHNHQSAQTQLESLKEGLLATGEVLQSYERMFNAGRRGWLDVMNSARELTRIELSITNLEAQLAATYLLLQLYNNEPLILQTPN